MNVQYRSTWFYLLILLSGLIVAYWPVSFHVFSLKNDALNYFLPVRRLVSESWYNHIIPVWTPYMNLGYPLYGDMQSGVWNPIVQLFSLLGPYQLYTLHVESLLYIYLAGTGMFFLLRYLKMHPHANLMISFAYMLCGFASDSMQFLNWIAALSFLPFIFLFYHRTLNEQSTRYAVYTGFFFYLLFTTAYPADFILTSYLVAFMFIAYLFSKRKQVELKKLLVNHTVIVVVFLLLSAPAIISYIQTLPLTERGTGATYQQAMSNPLHPALLSAYVVPLAIAKMPGVQITDPLLRNSYIGIIPFIFLLCALFTRAKNADMRFLKYGFFASVLFSMGEMGGLRIVAYYILPLMDSFRHPANARLFTIFFGCVLAAYPVHYFFRGELNRTKLKIPYLITIAIVCALIVWSAIVSDSILFKNFSPGKNLSFSSTAKSILDNLQFVDVVLISIIIQVPFLFFAARWIKRHQPRYLLAASIINNILITILLQPHTVVKNETAQSVQQLINKFAVDGYPLLDATTTLNDYSIDGMKYFKEIGVLNLYNKKPGRVDYRISPSNLLSQNEFWFNDTLRQTILNYPLLYAADSAITGYPALATNAIRYVFVDSPALAASINQLNPPVNINATFEEFLPNRFTLRIQTDAPAYFVLLQNYFPNWRMVIDGVPSTIDKVNRTFMGFRLPEGDHQVQFHFESRTVMIAWWISVVCILLLLVYRIRYIFP